MGRCDSYATEFDLEAEEYVPMPKGDVHKKKEIVQVRAMLHPTVFPVHATHICGRIRRLHPPAARRAACRVPQGQCTNKRLSQSTHTNTVGAVSQMSAIFRELKVL